MSSPRRLALIGIASAAIALCVVSSILRTQKEAVREPRGSNAPSIELNPVYLQNRLSSRPTAPKPRLVAPDIEITDANSSLVSSPADGNLDVIAEVPVDLHSRAKPEVLERALWAMVDAEKSLGNAHVLVQVKPDEIRLFVSPNQSSRRSGRAYRRPVPKSNSSQNRKKVPSIADRHDNVIDSRASEMVGRYNIWD